MIPMGRHDASGLSLLLRALRFARSSVPYGVSGRPSLNVDAMLLNVAMGGVPGGGSGGGAPRRPPPAGAPRQTPEKSGLPSDVRGAGALRSTSPFAFLGVL